MTLMELLIVMALMAILGAIAVPSFVQWRKNLVYKTTTRSLLYALRDARDKAITTNREYEVLFAAANQPNTQYRVMEGTQARNGAASTFTTVVQDWVALPAEVVANPTIAAIPFNANGTAAIPALSTIAVQDAAGGTRFTVEVSPTGRIRTY